MRGNAVGSAQLSSSVAMCNKLEVGLDVGTGLKKSE